MSKDLKFGYVGGGMTFQRGGPRRRTLTEELDGMAAQAAAKPRTAADQARRRKRQRQKAARRRNR